MATWDASLVEYNSPAFKKGFVAGKAGRSPAFDQRDEGNPDYASYMEGWLMGNCEWESR